MDKLELVTLLSGREPEAITRTLAMMAYNPAIGRVLEKGGVAKFVDLMVETMPRFYGNVTREQGFSLVGINKEIYLAWQELLRSLYPAKPVMLDVIWALGRRKIPDLEEEAGP